VAAPAGHARTEIRDQGPTAREVALEAGLVEGREHPSIAGDQHARFELWPEVEGDLDIVAARLAYQSALGFEPGVEVRAAQRREQSHHRPGDAGLLDEGELGVEDLGAVAIQAEDEAARDFDSLALDRAHRVEEIFGVVTTNVLRLARALQGFRVGAFDPQEHHAEPGRDHGVEQRLVLRQVDARLGEQIEGVGPRALPGGDRRQQA